MKTLCSHVTVTGTELISNPFRHLPPWLVCCLAVDMMLGGKSLFPNLTSRIGRVFSASKRLRTPTAAVFP